ncbi:MAG: CoA transferase [Candidatus Dormibacteria bacterium]
MTDTIPAGALPPPAALPGPLQGVRVLEFGSIVFAPLATQHLGDMGADVIKIEPPEGDMARWIGPHRSPGMGALFMNCNRNKRSVVLDLSRPLEREVLHKLAISADVVVNSIRTSSAERIGLTYAALSEHNPGLIFCHARGFSDRGTYAGKPAYDDVIQALSGLAQLQTIVGGEPRFVPTILADKISSLHAAYAVALALFNRLRTGRGQEIDVPMFELMTAFNTTEHLWGHAFEPPIDEMGYKPIRYAARRPFRTLDGYIVVLPYSDQHWSRFFAAIDQPERMNDPRFHSFPERQQNYEFVFGSLGAHIAQKTTAAWVELLERIDVPFAVVNRLEDLLDDPHLTSVDFWEFPEHPTEGKLRVARNAMEFSQSPAAITRLAPRLGEHTREVLLELGLEETTIQQLVPPPPPSPPTTEPRA